jgi:hypothetical protein
MRMNLEVELSISKHGDINVMLICSFRRMRTRNMLVSQLVGPSPQ